MMGKTMVWPQFRRFKTLAALKERAEQMYKDRPELQAKWLASVIYLRNESKKGWVGDEKVPTPEVSAPVLKLRATDRMVEIKRGGS